MAMTPDDFTQRIKAVCGEDLRAVVLFGSAAAGDHAGTTSDYNVLVVLARLGTAELSALSGVTAQWAKDGNPPPLLFTPDGLRRSADVFPIEFSDIKENHRVLFGQDPLADLTVDLKHLRFELEHELKGKLMLLRNMFMLAQGKPDRVEAVIVESVSAFLTLLRAVLRLHGVAPPAKKIDVLPALKPHVAFDDEALRLAADLKARPKDFKGDPVAIFDRYLKAVEAVADAVDRWK